MNLSSKRGGVLWAIVLVAGTMLAQSLPRIEANTNHTPAGDLRSGTLVLRLEIARGEWHPEAEDGIGLAVYAFGEPGKPLQNPGPLIRVPQGTRIEALVHNALKVPVTIHGLSDPAEGKDSSMALDPGETKAAQFSASRPGLFLYWGATGSQDLKLRYGIDSELSGAFVVDPPNASKDDEIFVLEMISDRPGAGARETLATINGKSWPHTQQFKYDIGRQVRWRWINATNEPHALHLHGFYFRIEATNDGSKQQLFSGDARPEVVTQRIVQGQSFDMSWSPERAGRWLFHCHMLQHMIPAVVPAVPGLETHAGNTPSPKHDHMVQGMGQLVLGIVVPEAPGAPKPAAWHSERKIRLEISERPGPPRYALRLSELRDLNNTDKPGLIGPPIVLTQGQPVEIEVVNKLHEPTAIHWHGIELESYYDGVPGWTGNSQQTTPAIAPGASFVARMAPPRSGTFIYHTHWHDPSQLTNGIYGPLIVLPPGTKYDPLHDLAFVFSIGDFGDLQDLGLINGTPQSKSLQLESGRDYRFRLINISTNNQAMQVSLRDAAEPVEWRVVAKDGSDFSPNSVHPSKAQLTVSVGETYDVIFRAEGKKELLLELLMPGQKIRTSQTLVFAPPEQFPQ